MKLEPCFSTAKITCAITVALSVTFLSWLLSPPLQGRVVRVDPLCVEVEAQQLVIQKLAQDVDEVNTHLLTISDQIQYGE